MSTTKIQEGPEPTIESDEEQVASEGQPPLTPEEDAEVQALKERKDVKSALGQSTKEREEETPSARAHQGVTLGIYFVLLLALYAIYSLLDQGFSPLIGSGLAVTAQRVALAAGALVLVLTASEIADLALVNRIQSASTRYNVKRILKLVAWIAIAVGILSSLRADWYTLLLPLGLVSVVVGLALQSTLSSFFGWIYILIRRPYQVGDRIKIGNAKGDVIDVGYLDTTLWEFGGEYLYTDHPSGRIIKFPNSQVLTNLVFNYTWPLFPYVWNEIKFQIAYQSDLEFVATTMQQVVEEEMGEFMMQRVRAYRAILAQTPVDELTVQERPAVHFRVNDNTWLDAIVRYLVHPKSQGRVKTRLIKKILSRLNAEPDRVMFPKGDAR